MAGGRNSLGPRGFLTEEEKQSMPKVTKELLLRILSYLKPYWLQFLFVFVAILLSATVGLLPAIITGRIVDQALVGKDLALLIRLLIMAFCALGVSQLIGVLESYINSWISQRIIYDMKNQMYRHLQYMPHSFFTTEKQGDIITTVLTCANGETILLRLDTTLPRSYSREFTVRGTKGLYMQDTNTFFFDGEKEYFSPVEYYKKNLDNAAKYQQEYLPALWKNMSQEEIEKGHGGIDWLAYAAFVEALKNGDEMPVDVYDAATWQAVSVLSEISIRQGGAPQAMPDFTGGKWMKRKRKDVCEL